MRKPIKPQKGYGAGREMDDVHRRLQELEDRTVDSYELSGSVDSALEVLSGSVDSAITVLSGSVNSAIQAISGGGLTSVTHDNSLSGAGTGASPLSAVPTFTSVQAGVTASFADWSGDLSVRGSITGSAVYVRGNGANTFQSFGTLGSRYATLAGDVGGNLIVGGSTSPGATPSVTVMDWDVNSGKTAARGDLVVTGSLTGSGDAKFNRNVSVASQLSVLGGASPSVMLTGSISGWLEIRGPQSTNPSIRLQTTSQPSSNIWDIRLPRAVDEGEFSLHDVVSNAQRFLIDPRGKITLWNDVAVGKNLVVTGSLTGSGDATFGRNVYAGTNGGFWLNPTRTAGINAGATDELWVRAGNLDGRIKAFANGNVAVAQDLLVTGSITGSAAQIGNARITKQLYAPRPTLSRNAVEFNIAAESKVAIGDVVDGGGNPTVYFYRTTSGFPTGTAARMTLLTSNGDLRIQQGNNNQAYGAETYTDLIRWDANGHAYIPSGSLGIGPLTSTPSSKLHIRGADNGLTDGALRIVSNKTGWGDITSILQTTAGGTTATDNLRIGIDSGFVRLSSGGGFVLTLDHAKNAGFAGDVFLTGTLRVGSEIQHSGAAVTFNQYVRINDYDNQAWDGSTVNGSTLISRDKALMIWTGGMAVGQWADGNLPSAYGVNGMLRVQKDATVESAFTGTFGLFTGSLIDGLILRSGSNANASSVAGTLLRLDSAEDAFITFRPGSNQGGILFNNSTQAQDGYIRYGQTARALTFASAGTIRQTIDGRGVQVTGSEIITQDLSVLGSITGSGGALFNNVTINGGLTAPNFWNGVEAAISGAFAVAVTITGSFLGRMILSPSGTENVTGSWTPLLGTKIVHVRMCGAGGGGGSALGVGAGAAAAGGGGGAGWYMEFWATGSAGSLITGGGYRVAGTGSAGTSGGGGGTGGTTSLVVGYAGGTRTWYATGGTGGQGGSGGFASSQVSGGVGSPGFLYPTDGTTDIVRADNGCPGFSVFAGGTAQVTFGGNGASSPFGNGGLGSTSFTNGGAAGGPGAGGGGGSATNVNKNGGNGGNGLIIIEMFG